MTPPKYAAFISPHGFGHAARSSAVMRALHDRNGARFEIFSTLPRWFLNESLAGLHRYHEVECDVGFRQASALRIDLAATRAALERMLPFDERLIDRIATDVAAAGCKAVLCDIAPMGIAVAERAGLPSVLLESFTWPWLYQPFHSEEPALEALGSELDRWSSRATVHVRTEPSCFDGTDGFRCHQVDPISRLPRSTRSATRDRLGVPSDADSVVITMGGYPEEMPFLPRLSEHPDIVFLVTGAQETHREGNALLFSNRSPLYMPDLLRAADALVGKLGYGTISEAWREGLPAAFVSRLDFREMPPLESFVRERLHGFQIRPTEFGTAEWISRIPELLEMPREERGVGGVGDVARILDELVVRGSS
jgi:UDP:flavonoid glycosyltransferase YjiC (YdhE family)